MEVGIPAFMSRSDRHVPVRDSTILTTAFSTRTLVFGSFLILFRSLRT